jgi:hypothetical protein
VPILQGAVAYRKDFDEREQWTNRRAESISVACFSGCSVEYDLIVSIQASDRDVQRWIGLMFARMKRECPKHSDCIRF